MEKQTGKISSKQFQLFSALSVLSGLAALFFTFAVPSESRNALFGGYSLGRWLLGFVTLLGTAVFLGLLVHEIRTGGEVSRKINGVLCSGDRAYFVFLTLLGCLFAALWAFKFSWLFVPKNLRPQILWAAVIFLSGAIIIFAAFHKDFSAADVKEKYRLFPRFRDLSSRQRKTLVPLIVLSLIYIIILIPSNINGTRDWAAFQSYGGDEYIIYPILQNVMDPGNNYSEWLYHHYIHEDYHYGYPFYAVSSLVVLPFRLIAGPDFMQRIDLTLPALRIMVSVVPLMLACLVLVFLTTHFEDPFVSSAVYLFLILTPGALQNNQGFWHPDGLNLLFICLAIYFLQRDRLRFGRNFYLSAFFIGLSAAIRLFGFFFFLAVFVCLLSGVIMKKLSVRKAVWKGFLYILVMAGTILWSDPFLFRADARQNMIRIITETGSDISSGFHGDPDDPKNDYRTGWNAWYPAFEDHYARMFCFFFLIFSMAAACFWGRDKWTFRIIALWWVVVSSYLIWFVAIKSTQYVLPMMLPLMSCIFALPRALRDHQNKTVRVSTWILAWGIFAAQFIINLIRILPRFQ